MTFHVALWILGVVLLAQFSAVAWAVIGQGKDGRFSLNAPASGSPIDNHSEIGEPEYAIEIPDDPGSLGTSLPNFPSDPDDSRPPGVTAPPLPPEIGADDPPPIPPELGGSGRPTPRSPLALETSPKPGSTDPYYIVPASARIRSPEVLGTIAAAITMRGDGDTLGALESLRRADSMRPNNPRILFEIATTFHHMGQMEKATNYWQRVIEMGESGAGDYFALADIEISGTKNTPPGGEPIEASRGIIYMGDIVASRDPQTLDGEKVNVRIPINTHSQAGIRPDKVAAYIYFFDIVGGERIEQTTARTEITQNWSSTPIDWRTSEPESLDVTYFQRPALTEPGAPVPQSRKYYGYIIRLFYDNVLQDVVANPRTLIDFNPAGKDDNPQLDDALFGGS